MVDFTDMANIREVAFSDVVDDVGASDEWSSYWYNGRIYQGDITRGLLIWRLDDRSVIQYLRTPHLNPQTQETTID
jgi:hypothetical protein